MVHLVDAVNRCDGVPFWVMLRVLLLEEWRMGIYAGPINSGRWLGRIEFKCY